LTPPLAFIVILLIVAFWFSFCSLFSTKAQAETLGKKKAYACGEDLPTHKIRPDYSEFFPYAYFFTIMHVVAMMIATIPKISFEVALIGIFYLVGGIVCLSILFRS